MGVKTARSNEEYKLTARDRDLFSDFNHSFLPHPNTGQITRKTNVDSVKLALRNLILTNKYERLRNPTYGSNIGHWLFEQLNDPRQTREIEQHIREVVKNFEPRVRLLEVTATADDEGNAVHVYISFSIVSSKSSEDLNITLYRVR